MATNTDIHESTDVEQFYKIIFLSSKMQRFLIYFKSVGVFFSSGTFWLVTLKNLFISILSLLMSYDRFSVWECCIMTFYRVFVRCTSVHVLWTRDFVLEIHWNRPGKFVWKYCMNHYSDFHSCFSLIFKAFSNSNVNHQ